MQGEIHVVNNVDNHGNPAGGFVKGIGLDIRWQNGPLGRPPDRVEPNGAFVETVILAAHQRIEFYQQGKFICWENAEALKHLRAALDWLARRTEGRESRRVEGTHTP